MFVSIDDDDHFEDYQNYLEMEGGDDQAVAKPAATPAPAAAAPADNEVAKVEKKYNA